MRRRWAGWLSQIGELWVDLGWLERLGILVLSPLALTGLARGMQNALGLRPVGGSVDLAAYWSPAQALLARMDPYAAVLVESPLIQYPAAVQELFPGGFPLPGNAPLMLVLVSPLAALPWPTARLVFALFNLGLAIIIPFLLFRMYEPGLSNLARWLFAAGFWAALPTRSVITTAQSTFLVMVAGLLSMRLANSGPVASGLLLGLSLVKFSVTLPLLAYFALQRRWRPLLIAGGVHAASVFAIGHWAGAPASEIIGGYLQLVTRYAPVVGDLDLISLLRRLGAPDVLAALVLLAGISAALFGLWQWQGGTGQQQSQGWSWRDAHLSAFLLVSSLPFIYHRHYDAVLLAIVPLAVVATGGRPAEADPGVPRTFWLSVALLSFFLLPKDLLAALVPGWGSVHIALSVVVALAVWAISFSLIVRPPEHAPRAAP